MCPTFSTWLLMSSYVGENSSIEDDAYSSDNAGGQNFSNRGVVGRFLMLYKLKRDDEIMESSVISLAPNFKVLWCARYHDSSTDLDQRSMRRDILHGID